MSTYPRNRRRARCTAVLATAVLMTACQGTEGDPTTPGDPDADARVERAGAAFDDVAGWMADGDTQALRDATSGPAASWFTHVDARRQASGDAAGDVFPRLRAEQGEATPDGEGVVFAGPVSWGDPEGPPARVLTDLVFVPDGDGWTLDSFERNGTPIARWVGSAPDGETVGTPPVTAEVVSVFVDVTCLDGTDPDCPEQLAGGLAVDFEVTNDSDGPLAPGEVTLPDGSTAVAWLETPAGPHPLLDAAVQGFPPGETSAVSAIVGGVADMGEGGVLHTALVTADGTTHRLDLPVPEYPAAG